MATIKMIIGTFVLLTTILSSVLSSGVFELHLKSFVNENGKDSLGKCCSGVQMPNSQECSGVCRTRFRVCLKQYQANIDTTTPCTYGDVVTPVLGDNVLKNLNSTTDFTNPIRFPFDFTWPGTFSLIVEAFHDNTDNATHVWTGSSGGSSNNDRVIITRLATQRWLDVGTDWVEDTHKSHHSSMIYEYRVTCTAHYYGKGCENLCRPRDDNFGHYTCSPTGQRVCLTGWKGDYCAIPQCLPGCDEQHGYCSRPNECQCHSGWSGTYCDQCLRYPGCLHGSCQRPWECLCDEGWGGLFCNQDLNYCTNHKPCRNGGTCFNTGHGVYTCACAPGFTGKDCQVPLLDCQSQPCLNQGTCLPTANNATYLEAFTSTSDGYEISIARKYRCACPAGWRGRHCEVSSRSCRDSPCARNATCEDDSQRGFKCHCPAGFTGSDCEQQIDECAPNPCANGATCTDLVNGFKCTCPPGFTGERCQTNINDCASNPCLNGATCYDNVNKFRCQCVPGYTGDICQLKVDICPGKPCANGGTCINLTNDFECSCMPGFTGKDCSIELDECESSPCQHGGTCRNRVNGFVCDCTDGWRGETCSESTIRPGQTGYWSSTRGRQAQAVAAAPESRHTALSTEHVVVIATISTAVPAFVLVALLAVMCMKRRQKREQAKADEEARLQNERNAVHSSMTKRATAMLSGPLDPVAVGDAHMIKNTWSVQQSSCSQIAASERSCSSTSGKSVNNDNIYESSLHDGSSYNKAESSVLSVAPDVVCRQQRSTKQLNTEAAAHRASQHLYQKQDKDSCLAESKRVSSMYPSTESPCCAAVCVAELKRPNTSIAESPPDDTVHTSDSGGCGVYVIDDHYAAQQLATQV